MLFPHPSVANYTFVLFDPMFIKNPAIKIIASSLWTSDNFDHEIIMKTNDHFGHISIWDDFNHETVMITSSLWTSDPFDHGIVINMVGKGTNEYFELDHI